jgi:hypothetical protein
MESDQGSPDSPHGETRKHENGLRFADCSSNEIHKKLAVLLLGVAVQMGPLYGEDVRAQAVLPATPYQVGMTQVEYADPAAGGRALNFMLIYPATPDPAPGPTRSLCLPTCTCTKMRHPWRTV